jgi:hypothetical protein
MNRNVLHLKHYISETGLCLRRQVEPTQLGPINRAGLCLRTTVVQVKVILWPTINWPVCPGIRPPSQGHEQFFFQLHGNYTQTAGWFLSMGRPFWLVVVRSSFWASPAQSFSCLLLVTLITLFQCLNFELGGSGAGWLNCIPRNWVPFCRLLQLAGLRWRQSNPPPHV